MNRNRTPNPLHLCALLSALCLPVLAQFQVISYEGQLNDGGNPANGSYDLTFTFFSFPSGGTPLAGPITNAPTAVVNGLFTANLTNVNSGIFNSGINGAHFLEIAVRTNGSSGPYAVLSPRESLAYTPYAEYALTAQTAYGVAGNSVTAVGIAAGQVVKSLNGLEDAVTLSPGANVTITPSGNTLTIASTAGGGGGVSSLNGLQNSVSLAAGANLTLTTNGNTLTYSSTGGSGGGAGWSLAGNNIDPGQFLGSTNNQALQLRSDNEPGFQIQVVSHSTASSMNVVGGYWSNSIANNAIGATISGGGYFDSNGNASAPNTVTADFGTVVGGFNNSASSAAFVGGGAYNTASGAWSIVGGGNANNATTNSATIGGGSGNNAGGSFATVAGGDGNSASGIGAVVGGGGYDGNTAAGNLASGNGSVVSGGVGNNATNAWATVGGGRNGTAASNYATVSGGFHNLALGAGATVAGGSVNTANGAVATVAGGQLNTAFGDDATVGGGINNATSAGSATVSGGSGNSAGNTGATVAGGVNNIASGAGSVVSGGGYDGTTFSANVASGNASVVSGGANNIGAGYAATVAGGTQNQATNFASVSGGTGNLASGQYAMVPGGQNNLAGGDYSFAGGNGAATYESGDFVWNDGSLPGYQSYGAGGGGTFHVTTKGGVMFQTDGVVRFEDVSNQGAFGVQWQPGTGLWIFSSDRNAKDRIKPADPESILEKLSKLPLFEWSYKGYPQRHLGPMAQDFHAQFPWNENDRGINELDLSGVELAAIQGLNQKLEAALKRKDAENAELKQRNDALEQRLEALEAIVLKLEQYNQ